MQNDADIMLGGGTKSDADIMMSEGLDDASKMLGPTNLVPKPVSVEGIAEELRAEHTKEKIEGTIQGAYMKELLKPSVDEFDRLKTNPVLSSEFKQGFMDTLKGYASLATQPMEIVRGGAEFALALPGFALGILGAGQKIVERMGKPFTVNDLYDAASEGMNEVQEFWGEKVTEPLLGKPTAESQLVGQTAMAPAIGLSMLGQHASKFFEGHPNVQGVLKFAGDISGLAALGRLYRGSKSELTAKVEDVTRKAEEVAKVQEEVNGIQDEDIKAAQQKILDVKKNQLEMEAKAIQDNLDYGKMIKEDLNAKGRKVAQIKQPKKQILDEQVDKAMEKIKTAKEKPTEEPGVTEDLATIKAIEDRYGKKINEISDEEVEKWFTEKYEPEEVSDVDLQTGTREPLELSTENSPFRERDPEKTVQQLKLLSEKKIVDSPEMIVAKPLAEVNSWLDGVEGIDVEKSRNWLSDFAVAVNDPGNRIQLLDYFDGDISALNNFAEMVGEAASWARRAERPSGDVRLPKALKFVEGELGFGIPEGKELTILDEPKPGVYTVNWEGRDVNIDINDPVNNVRVVPRKGEPGTKLYSGIPVDEGWKFFREIETNLKDKIKDWLMDRTKEMPKPDALYRGIPTGAPREEAAGRSMHGTPWPYVASSGGKFGGPGTHDVYKYPVTEDTIFYRGGALAGDPLEATRIPSTGGMTWEQVLRQAKELYYKDLAKERVRAKQYNMEPSESGVAEKVINDIRYATYEVDLSGKPGIWRGKGIPPDRNELSPRLRSLDDLIEAVETKLKQGYADEDIPELSILFRRRTTPEGTYLYDIGGATAEGVRQLIKGADDFAKYLKDAKAYKKFKPKEATKLLKESLKRNFVDRSGNIRVDLLNSLGEDGYKIIQKMYLSKGASSRSANMLKQMQKEVYRGLSRQDKEILDGLILSDRMADIANYKLKFKFPKYISTDGKVPDKTIVWRETFKQRYKLSEEKAADLQRRAEAYFEWMKKPLRDMLDAELISPDEYEALVSHNYRRIKLVDLVDKRYQAKVGARKRTVYDSGVESLAKGRVTDIYEPSSEVMALEVFNRAYGRIMNNEANRTLLDLARKDPENSFVRVKEKQGPKIPSGWNRLFVYEAGQRKAIYLSPEMSKEWIINSPETSYRFSQFLRYASGSPVLRTFATGINWGFALANLPRDVMHTWFTARIFEDGKWKHVYSPHAPLAGLQMARDQLAVFGDAALRKSRYQDYINEGGGMEFMVHQGRILQRGRHLEGPLDKIQNFLGYFGETSEVMTRLAIRERALRRGATPSEATFAARDYMDFGQGGGIAKALDNAVPYLNASIQGTRGLIRSMKENPLVSTYKLAQFAALTSGIYIAMKSRAPETEKNLRGSLDMTNNLVIPLGDEFGFLDNEGQMRYPYIKIPLDPSQRFFKKFFEASTDKWLGDEVDVDGTVDALNELTPVSVSGLPPTLSGALGYISNKDFWLNEDIWKQSEPFSYPGSKEEYTSRTPETFVDVGKVTGLSPERLKYSVSELVTNGTVWSYLAGEGYDKLFGDLPKEKKEEHLAMVLSEIPVAKRFIGVTNPYTKHATKMDKAQEEAVLKQFVENRNFDIKVEGYLYGEKGEVTMRDIQKEANQYKDPETYERLMKRLEFERGIKNLPEKSFWRRMKGLRTEAKAKVFVDRLQSSTPEERSQLWKEASIAQAAGGVISDEFFDEVNKQYIK